MATVAHMKTMIYKDRTHLCVLGGKLKEFRNTSRYTDVIIETSDTDYPAHKNILASSSDFWISMFEGGFKESDQKTISLKHISSVAFKIILNFVYTSKVSVSADVVGCLYEAADYMHYNFLKKNCVKFMVSSIHADTCLEYFHIADRYCLTDLQNKIKDYIFNNLEELSTNSMLYELPCKMFAELIAVDVLVCRSEKTVLDVITHYLEVNKDLSMEDIRQVVDQLRFGLLDTDELSSLKLLEPYLGHERVFEINEDIAKYSTGLHMQPFIFNKYYKPRTPTQFIIMGGSNKVVIGKDQHTEAFNTVTLFDIMPNHCFDGEQSRLYQKDDIDDIQRHLPEPMHSFSAVVMGNFVFIIGGQIKGMPWPTSNVYRYNLLKNEWIYLSKMPQKIRNHVAALCGMVIIVVGGRNEAGVVQNSVYSYDIANDGWKEMNAFPKRVERAATCMGNGRMFVSGGVSKPAEGANSRDELTVHDGIHEYDSIKDCWMFKGSLSSARQAHSMCFYDNKLYVIGGMNSVSLHANIQCFDLELNQCNILKVDMPYFRAFSSCVQIDSTIFVIGGIGCDRHEASGTTGTNNKVNDSILVYDITNQYWMEEYCKLPEAVNGLSCVVRSNTLHEH